MVLLRVPRFLGIACILLLSVSAQNPVHIQYSPQLLTSSTLNWIPHTYYYNTKISRDIVIGGFEIFEHKVNNDTSKTITRETPIYVCRVQHEGTWVAGSQKQGDRKCTVNFQGILRTYDRYDLLENVDSAGRLSWTVWDKFTVLPNGVVAVHDQELYVARHINSRKQNDSPELKYTSHCIGTLTKEDNLGEIVCAQDGRFQKRFEKGEILVETEPTKYDLTGVRLNTKKQRVIKNAQRILGEATMKNTGTERAKIAEAFGYEYSYLIYWGQVRAMSKGLDTSITLLNGTSLRNVKWGTEDRGNESTVHTVEVILEPGTAVNVTLIGNYTEIEAFYSGDLISHYPDASTKSRSINGFRREEGLTEVRAVIGPAYFLSNWSVVPTTEPPTSTAPPTTTEAMSTTTSAPPTTATMPTTKRAPQPPILMSGVDEKVTKDEEVDENMIMSPKKTELGLAGDGGPMSLNARSGDRSSAQLPKTVVSLLLLLLCVNKVT